MKRLLAALGVAFSARSAATCHGLSITLKAEITADGQNSPPITGRVDDLLSPICVQSIRSCSTSGLDSSSLRFSGATGGGHIRDPAFHVDATWASPRALRRSRMDLRAEIRRVPRAGLRDGRRDEACVPARLRVPTLRRSPLKPGPIVWVMGHLASNAVANATPDFPKERCKISQSPYKYVARPKEGHT
jgi:hypothetical protein